MNVRNVSASLLMHYISMDVSGKSRIEWKNSQFLPCPLGIPGTASYGTGSGGFTCCGPHTFVICSSFIISIVSACGTDSLDC